MTWSQPSMHAAQPIGQFRRRKGLAGTPVHHRVERQRNVFAAALRVSDLEVEEAAFDLGIGQERDGKSHEEGRHEG